jgi:hypothetical protein
MMKADAGRLGEGHHMVIAVLASAAKRNHVLRLVCEPCRSQQLLAKPSARRSNRAISLYARKLLIAHRKFDDSRRG